MNISFYWQLVRDAFAKWQEDRAPRMGAALAYYVSFSLAPLLIIAIAIAGAVFGPSAARGEIVGEIDSTVGRPAAQNIEEMLRNTAAPEGNILMIVIGSVVLLLAASGAFAELQDSLNTIFKAPPKKTSGIWNAIRMRLLSFAMVLVIGFLLLVSLILSAALSAVATFVSNSGLPGGPMLWEGINWLVSFAFITVLFALIYKVLPDEDLRWGDVWLGALVTAFLFTLGKFLLGLYLGAAGATSTFGAAGSFMLILVWVYYSAQILLFGAELTYLWSVRRRALAPRPSQEWEAAPRPEGYKAVR